VLHSDKSIESISISTCICIYIINPKRTCIPLHHHPGRSLRFRRHWEKEGGRGDEAWRASCPPEDSNDDNLNEILNE
jgi:hypothetical protein